MATMANDNREGRHGQNPDEALSTTSGSTRNSTIFGSSSGTPVEAANHESQYEAKTPVMSNCVVAMLHSSKITPNHFALAPPPLTLPPSAAVDLIPGCPEDKTGNIRGERCPSTIIPLDQRDQSQTPSRPVAPFSSAQTEPIVMSRTYPTKTTSLAPPTVAAYLNSSSAHFLDRSSSFALAAVTTTPTLWFSTVVSISACTVAHAAGRCVGCMGSAWTNFSPNHPISGGDVVLRSTIPHDHSTSRLEPDVFELQQQQPNTQQRSGVTVDQVQVSSNGVANRQHNERPSRSPYRVVVAKKATTMSAGPKPKDSQMKLAVAAVQGIPNLGQTCFVNAVLQALAALEPFVLYLERLEELRLKEQLQRQAKHHPPIRQVMQQSSRRHQSGPPDVGSWSSAWTSMIRTLVLTSTSSSLSTTNGARLGWRSAQHDNEEDEYDGPDAVAQWHATPLFSKTTFNQRISTYSRRCTEDLLAFLDAVNGKSMDVRGGSSSLYVRLFHYHHRLDPRPILHAVSQHAPQFRSNPAVEQQDAQEFLQALIGAIVHENGLDHSTSPLSSTFAASSSLLVATEMHDVHDDDRAQIHVKVGDSLEGHHRGQFDTIIHGTEDEDEWWEIGTLLSGQRRSHGLQNKPGLSSSLVNSSVNCPQMVIPHSNGDGPRASAAGAVLLATSSGTALSLPLNRVNAGRQCLASSSSSSSSSSTSSNSTSSTDDKKVHPEDACEHSGGAPARCEANGIHHLDHSSHTPLENSNGGLPHIQTEEKKQEEFELHIPRVYSEDAISTPAENADDTIPSKVEVTLLKDSKIAEENRNRVIFSWQQGDDDAAEDVSFMSDASATTTNTCISKQGPLSAAMRIMTTTVSSTTPSPLCGWIGSSLRCRTCLHTRAIQCTPFYDIPVVPTAVSHSLSGRHLRTTHHGDNCSRIPHQHSLGSAGPSCTLEECLQEFTSVERVQNVECRSCTLHAEMQFVKEEMDLLAGAIQSVLARRRSISSKAIYGRAQRPNAQVQGNLENEGYVENEDQVIHLREEYHRFQECLSALQLVSPDDEEVCDELLRNSSTSQDVITAASGGAFLSQSSSSMPLLQRSDAYKRLLLTRLPAILAIHVQRRYYDPVTNRMMKTWQHVIFPEFLNVAPFCAVHVAATEALSGAGRSQQSHNTAYPPPASGATQRQPTPTPTPPIQYRIMAVIEHRGGAFYGHYVCYRRDPASVDDRDWVFLSDETVKKVRWSDVENCQAYMLFYEAV